LQNIAGTNAATRRQKLEDDFPSLSVMLLHFTNFPFYPKIFSVTGKEFGERTGATSVRLMGRSEIKCFSM
jgi:fucose permease